MSGQKVLPVELSQGNITTPVDKVIVQPHWQGVNRRVSRPRRSVWVAKSVQANGEPVLEIRQSPPGLASAPPTGLVDVSRPIQRHKHSFATGVLHIKPVFA